MSADEKAGTKSELRAVDDALYSDPSLPEEQNTPEVQILDGGRRAWLTVAGSWLVYFGTFGYAYSFGVYQDYYTRIYLTNHSPSSISWIGSLQLMMPYFFGVVSGGLFDRGYFYVLVLVGCVLFIISLFMLSLAKPDQYYQIILSQGVGMGLGLGLTFVPIIGVQTHHFKRRRGLAIGIAQTGSGCGAIVFPIMINNLLQKESFGDAVRASAYVVLACLVVGASLMRTQPPPGGTKAATDIANIKSWFTEAPFMWALLANFFINLGFFFPLTYLQLYAVQHDVDLNLAFYSLAILNASGCFGRIIGNQLSDIYGPFNILVPCTLVVGATIWAMLGISAQASLIVVTILYGLFSGACISLSVTAFAFLSKTPREVGARTGLGGIFASIALLFAGPIQGALLTSRFLWIRPIIFSTTLTFLASALLLLSRTLLVKERKSQRV